MGSGATCSADTAAAWGALWRTAAASLLSSQQGALQLLLNAFHRPIECL